MTLFTYFEELAHIAVLTENPELDAVYLIRTILSNFITVLKVVRLAICDLFLSNLCRTIDVLDHYHGVTWCRTMKWALILVPRAHVLIFSTKRY